MTGEFYDNRSLFSDYYLQNRMGDHPRWHEDLSGTLNEILDLYREHRDRLEGMNEAQTEEEFIRPVLHLLGFSWDVQPKVERQGQGNYPDYSLFKDEDDKREAQQYRDDPGTFYSHALALADAKYWRRPLDRFVDNPRERYTNRNPSFQIINYLTATGLEWGIITNGAVWRLYSTKARSRVDTYYETDLAAILEEALAARDDGAISEELLHAFKYFYHFFSATSLTRDPESDTTFLERVFDGSVQYGSELQTRLKDLIFDKIFIYLAEGFLADQRRNTPSGDSTSRTAGGESSPSLPQIYQGTLRLLYRLLFILYAEARDLLPVRDERGYGRYSLMALKRDAADAIDKNVTLSASGYDVWHDLQDLFRFIDQGEPDLNIPRYNGGLFRTDHPANAFLQQYAVPDKYLVPALELLTRDTDPDTGEKRFIDYKTLNVEQLGSIYEGLLEFHLRIAGEELAVVREKGTEVYRPAGDVENPLRTVQPGEVYLENDKGQRKATGSYYTPDYIVRYIVENTLGPVLEERTARFAELMEEIRDRTGGRRKQPVKQQEQQAVETFLGIKVCDPAMGSGHFLVRATDYLAEQIIAELDKYPDNPVIREIDAIRQDIVDNLEAQDIRIDSHVLKDTNLLKRMVMKRCIYGVDLNPMAVELAKLSLWLDSFTVGAPLSFLDHHLKVGNSLIGTTVGEVEDALETKPGETDDLFGSPFRGLLQAADFMRDVADLTDATVSEVEESRSKYNLFEGEVQPYKTILDLWVSRHFGNAGVKQVMEVHGQEVLHALKQGDPAELHESERQSLETAEESAARHHFFHWELEFPEVFIDLDRSNWKENPGFDVVMGNPPYVRQEQLSNYKPYFKVMYQSYHGVADLYVYFIEQGISKTREKGQFGYIVSNKFMRANYGEELRKFLLNNTEIQQIIDFGELPVFYEASAFPEILIASRVNSNSSQSVRTCLVQSLDFDSLRELILGRSYYVNEMGLSAAGWSLARIEVTEVIGKIENSSNFVILGEYVDDKIFRGITTGYNEAFVIDESTKRAIVNNGDKYKEIIKPLIIGDDVRKYEIKPRENYLLFCRRGIDIEKYPAVKEYLSQFKKKLIPKPRNHTCSWEGRKSGKYKWYEIQDTTDYWKYFETPKIVYPDISKESRFAIDLKNRYPVNTLYIIPVEDYYLLSLLNSSLVFFYMKHKSAVLGDADIGGRLRLIDQYMKQLPIPAQTRANKRLSINDIPSLPENLSKLSFHDTLAHLAQKMLDMHKRKQNEISGFLTWLERFTGTSLENLSGYTIIQEYYDLPGGREELIERLAKNNSKIPDNDMTGRKTQEQVIAEYEDSMSVLRPLLDRIAATDRLIDQIVYRLYGLTDEEIAVVEGADDSG